MGFQTNSQNIQRTKVICTQALSQNRILLTHFFNEANIIATKISEKNYKKGKLMFSIMETVQKS